MTPARRFLLALLIASAPVLAVSGTAAADDAPGADDNAAVAVNTEDGASVFRLAFSVRMVANGVIDERNIAYALASCTDCQTVALAFQVVLVWNDPNVAVPENIAVAYNDQCVECLTYASATQIVLGFDGPVRFTDEGRRLINELLKSLQSLEKRIGELSVTELNAEVQAAKADLLAILSTELVPADEEPTASATTSSTTTSSTVPESSTTSTTEGAASSTTTTTTEASTTTTAASTSTTTTEATTTSTTSATSSTTTSTTTTAPASSSTTAAP